MTPAPAEPPTRASGLPDDGPGGGALVTGGLVVALVAALVRATCVPEPFPYWSMDPTRIRVPVTGLTPSMGLALDGACWLALGLVLLGESRRGGRGLGVPVWAVVMLGVTCIPAAMHAWIIDGGSLENLSIGSGWAGAAAAGLAAMLACRRDALRRLTLAVAIGLIGMLAAKGMLQVFIEHPRTVEDYVSDRAAYLAAHGWSEGSAQARAFERRLMHAEASAWFGLANVLAGVAAAGVAWFAGVLACRPWRSDAAGTRRGWACTAWLVLGLLLSAWCVHAAGSKGGYALSVLGLSIVGVAAAARVRARARVADVALRLAAPAAMVLPLAAIAARGVVGERISELSLLFRWFYLEAACRIFASSPLVGVGPGDFKPAYMLAKSPISPEDVASPHSILFDYASTLGIGGVVIGALFGWMAGLAGAGAGHAASVGSARSGRGPAANGTDVRRGDGLPVARGERRVLGWIAALGASVAVISSAVEIAVVSPESQGARLIGLAAWIGLAWAAWHALDGVSRGTAACAAGRAAQAGAALTLVAACQFELTGTQGTSACWVWVVLGAAAGAACRRSTCRTSVGDGPRTRRIEVAAAAGCLAACAGVLVLGVVPTLRWEAALRRGVELVRAPVELGSRFESLAELSHPGDVAQGLGRLARELGGLLGRAVALDERSVSVALTELGASRARAARDALAAAAQRGPKHAETWQAASRLSLQAAGAWVLLGRHDEARTDAQRAEELAVQGVAVTLERSAASLGWLGTVRQTMGELLGEPGRLASAAEAWERAAALDPHGVTFPLRLMRAYRTMGDGERARAWARRALENDARLRLDPLVRLTDVERAEAEAQAGEP